LFELIRDNFLQTQSVFGVDEPIVENSQIFVDPKSQQGLLRVAVETVELKHALNDFRNIPHVENVVRLGRGRQEQVNDKFVQVDCGHCDKLSVRLDFFLKFLKFKG